MAAGDVPLYTAQERQPSVEGPLVQPLPLPPSGGLEQIGQAVSGFATAAAGVYEQYQNAKSLTQAAVASEKYLTKLDTLEEQYVKDQDYGTAKDRFTAAQREAELEFGQEIDDPRRRQMTMLQWRRAGLASGKRVGHAALGRENDADAAALVVEENAALKRVYEAGSNIEGQAAIADYTNSVNARVSAGRIRAEVGVQKIAQFERSVSIADVSRTIRVDPMQAQTLLADPKNFPGLDPVTRENYKNAAANHADQVKIDQIERQAETDPAGAREAVKGAGLQPHNYYRALTTVDHVEKANDAALTKAARDLAATDRSEDQVLELLKAGVDVPQQQYESTYNTQMAAAQRGDRAAYKYAQQMDLWRSLAPQVRQAYSMPIGVLDTAVHQMEAAIYAPGANATPDDMQKYKAFKAVRDEVVQKRDSEPIVLGGQNGGKFYMLGPLDASAPTDDTRNNTELAARNAHALTAKQVYGGSGSALTREEASAFKQRFDNAGPNEQFKMLQMFGRTLSGDAYDGTIAEVAGKDPRLQLIGSLAQSRPDIARQMLQGVNVLSDTNTREKSAIVRGELVSRIGGMIYTQPDQQELLVSSALALDAGRRAATSSLYDAADVSGLNKAIEDISGPLTKRNGRKLPITPGIARADFMTALDKVTPEDIALNGGAFDRAGKAVDPSFIASYGQLRPRGIGSNLYTVGVQDSQASDGFRAIFDASGNPLVFDMARMSAKHKGAIGPLSSYQEARGRFRAGQFERIRQAREGAGTQPPTEPPPITQTPAAAGTTDYPGLEE